MPHRSTRNSPFGTRVPGLLLGINNYIIGHLLVPVFRSYSLRAVDNSGPANPNRRGRLPSPGNARTPRGARRPLDLGFGFVA